MRRCSQRIRERSTTPSHGQRALERDDLPHDCPFLFPRSFCHNTTLKRYRLPNVTADVTGRVSRSKGCLLQREPQVTKSPIVMID